MAVMINRLNLSDQGGIVKAKAVGPVRVRNPVLAYSPVTSRANFTPPEYDLGEIGLVEDVDSYVRQGHRKKVGLGFKEGWDLVGRDSDTLTYIKQRFVQLARSQNKPWRIILRELFTDLVRLSNAFLVKVRDSTVSGGHPRQEGTKMLDPVAAYFIMPAETVSLKKDTNGKVTAIKQTIGSEEKTFRPEDVIHFTIDRKTGFSWGTPILVPVLEDIRVLRRIEENIDLLVHQNLFPLFQYIVGTEERPAGTNPDGSTEVDVVRTELEYMPPEGMIVTPERHKVQMIGAEGRALRAEGYLTHFKERVFAGQGMSSVDFGEGGTANRATASTLSDNIRDDVKSLQEDFESQVDFFVLQELLLEGKFSFDPLEEDHIVRLVFREVDKTAQIAYENHVAQMFAQHVINEDEARMAIGKDPVSVDDEDWRSKSFWRLVEEPKALILAGDESYLGLAAADNPMTSLQPEQVEEGRKTKVKETEAKKPSIGENRGQRAGAARDRPSNQHGTRFGPKAKKDFRIEDSFLMEAWETLLSDVKAYKQEGVFQEWIKRVIDAWTTNTGEKLNRSVRRRFLEGFRDGGLTLFNYDLSGQSASVEGHAAIYLQKLTGDLSNRLGRLEGGEDISRMMSILEISRNRVEAIYVSERNRAYNYGRLVCYRKRGFKKGHFAPVAGTCDICKEKAALEYDLALLSIDDLAPFHPYCDCKLVSSE